MRSPPRSILCCADQEVAVKWWEKDGSIRLTMVKSLSEIECRQLLKVGLMVRQQ